MTASWSGAWPAWALRPARQGWCTVLILLLALVVPAAAEDDVPLTPEQAADAAAAALRASDTAALKALAERDDPDPWLVADELCRRGEHDAAMAVAEVMPRAGTERLSAYVQARRGAGPETELR